MDAQQLDDVREQVFEATQMGILMGGWFCWCCGWTLKSFYGSEP